MLRSLIPYIGVLKVSSVGVSLLLPGPSAEAAETLPSHREMQAERHWLEEHLLHCKLSPLPVVPITAVSPPVEPGVDVLANHDPVTQNGRGGKPMKIGDKEYTRGLYCH